MVSSFFRHSESPNEPCQQIHGLAAFWLSLSFFHPYLISSSTRYHGKSIVLQSLQQFIFSDDGDKFLPCRFTEIRLPERTIGFSRCLNFIYPSLATPLHENLTRRYRCCRICIKGAPLCTRTFVPTLLMHTANRVIVGRIAYPS